MEKKNCYKKGGRILKNKWKKKIVIKKEEEF